MNYQQAVQFIKIGGVVAVYDGVEQVDVAGCLDELSYYRTGGFIFYSQY